MTKTGEPQITDFGISGLKNENWNSLQSDENFQDCETVLVSSHGMTPAY